jgi:hypothetical protein
VFSLRECWERSIVAAGCDAKRYRIEEARRSHPFSRDFSGGTLMLKRVVAIFDATQKVRKSLRVIEARAPALRISSSRIS